MSDDLIAFLRARLDEDEQAAKRADREGLNGVSPDEPQTWYLSGGETVYSEPHGVGLVTGIHGYLGDALGDHIVRQQPARVLAEVEVKRERIALHAETETGQCAVCVVGGWGYPAASKECRPATYPCTTLLLEALPFAGHPDYREEWRP